MPNNKALPKMEWIEAATGIHHLMPYVNGSASGFVLRYNSGAYVARPDYNGARSRTFATLNDGKLYVERKRSECDARSAHTSSGKRSRRHSGKAGTA